MNPARLSMARIWLWFLLLWLAVAETGLAQEQIRLGLYPGPKREWSRTEVRATFDLWAQELAEKFQIPVSFNHYDEPAAMRRDFLAGKIDGVQADAMSFIQLFKPEELAEGYATVMKGGWNLRLIAGGSVHGLDDLAGKRIAFLEEDPAGTLYLETLCLRKHKRACNAVFSDMQVVGTSNQALIRVFFGKADIALVHGYGHEVALEMNPQIGRGLKIVAEYPVHSLYYAFYSPKVDKSTRERTLRTMPTLHTYPRGRQLLDIFKIERLERATPADLRPLFELEREYRELSRLAARPARMPAARKGKP